MIIAALSGIIILSAFVTLPIFRCVARFIVRQSVGLFAWDVHSLAKMLDEDFFAHLEWRLSEAFASSDDTSIRQLWCDGIIPTYESDLSQKAVNDSRKTQLKAFLGNDGQSEYELVLNFGRKSLSRYARGLEIQSCIPDTDENDWYQVDTSGKIIAIQLL